MLNVVAKLVCENVGLGEVTIGAKPSLELVIETEIYIDLLIDRAIERTHRGLRETARRLRRVSEKHELGWRVRFIVSRQDFLPRAVGIIEHERHEENFILLARGILGSHRCSGGRSNSGLDTEIVEESPPGQKAQGEYDDRSPDAEPFSEPAHAPSILEILASAAWSPPHRVASSVSSPDKGKNLALATGRQHH
jgi:hypothetical protein